MELAFLIGISHFVLQKVLARASRRQSFDNSSCFESFQLCSRAIGLGHGDDVGIVLLSLPLRIQDTSPTTPGLASFTYLLTASFTTQVSNAARSLPDANEESAKLRAPPQSATPYSTDVNALP